MIVVADNLNTRNISYMSALEAMDSKALAGMARSLSAAHADVINVQCSLDGAGDEQRLPWAAEVIEEASGKTMLCLDSRNLGALKKALSVVKEPPLINYISETEPPENERETCLGLAGRSMARLVLRASRGSVPISFEGKLQILEDLLEAANRADIPNGRIFLDPSLVHLGRGAGQDNIMNSRECILAVKEMVDPPVSTIAWISNISAGISPRAARKMTEADALLYLAGAGLDAAMVDVLDAEIQKALYFIKSFRGEAVFSPADIP